MNWSTSRLHHLRLLFFCVLLVLFAALVGLWSSVNRAEAVIERIYTLPFYANYTITCSWGPYANCGPNLPPGNHNGTDYKLGQNTTGGEVVVSARQGTVWHWDDFSSQGPGKGCGYYIVIAHGNGQRTRYCHLADRVAANGAFVARGEVIGHEGNSGTSGVHLHFDTRHAGTDGSECCSGTSVDPYAGPYSPGTWMWEDQPIGGQPPNHADFSPAVASDVSNRVDVFVRGTNNDLYQKTWNGSSWSGWTRPHPGDYLKSGPAAVHPTSTNRIEVFYRGGENDLWWTRWNGTSWSVDVRPRPGDCLLSAPTVASWGFNRMDVFYRGCDNDLWWTTWNGTSWSVDTRPWPGSCLRSSPAAVSWGSGRIDLFYRGCDDAVFHQWYVNGSWPRANLGGCTMLAPAVSSWAANRLDVFYRGCEYGPAGGGLFTRSFNGSSWSGELFLGGCLASGPGSDAWAPEWLVAQYRGCDSPGRMFKMSYNGSWAESYFSTWAP